MKKLLDRKITFEEIFKFTDDEGHVKSLDWVYILGLTLSILFAYFAIEHYITLGFEEWFSGLSRGWLNFLDIGVSAILSTALFFVFYIISKNKTIMPVSFAAAVLFIIIVILFMLIKYDKETAATAIPVIVYMFLIPVAFGAICIWLMFLKYRKKEIEKQENL